MVSIYDHDNYVSYLRKVFEEKSQKNNSFSLRSFSRTLGLSASHLSRVLNGSKKLSTIMAGRVAQRLQLSRSESAYFGLLAQLNLAKNDISRQEILKAMEEKSRGAERRQLDAETLKAIADWRYLNLLALARTANFQFSAAWIAKRLAITENEATEALDKLFSLNLIEKQEDGTLKVAEISPQIMTEENLSITFVERYAQQLKRSEKALTQYHTALREFDSLALSFHPRNMVQAKRLIRDFIERFAEEMENGEGFEVYQLNMQFFQSSQ